MDYLKEYSKRIFKGGTIVMTSGFGMRKDPFTKENSIHKGTDLAPKGGKKLPMYALADGIVISVGHASDGSGWGNRIYIKYPSLGLIVQYAHMDTINVKVGDSVTNLTCVGNAGTTGRSTGVHNHLGACSISTWDKPFHDKDWMDPKVIIDRLVELENYKPEPVVPKPELIVPFKIGDKVTIVGRGNASMYGKSNIAGGLGWTRYITAIHTGKLFPYQVGNLGKTDSKNTTGFYQATALKKVV